MFCLFSKYMDTEHKMAKKKIDFYFSLQDCLGHSTFLYLFNVRLDSHRLMFLTLHVLVVQCEQLSVNFVN